MHIAKILLIGLYVVALMLAANQHGKYRTGKNNFWVSLIATALEIGLLWWGGFFS